MTFGQNRTPELSAVIRQAVSARLDGLHTSMPGKVEKYDATLQKADIKPLLKATTIFDDGTETSEALPVISDVPVVFPRGGGFFQTLPLAKGDLVLLVFCERSIDKYLDSMGLDTDPVDLRSFDLSDAVAIPGFYPFLKAIKGSLGSDAILGKENGPQLRIKEDGVEITSNGIPTSTGGYVALAQKVDLLWTTLYTVFTTGWVVAPTDGGAALKAAFIAAFPPPGPSSTASSNLKADL